ncbi:MAG: FAD-binding oxidoreductase [Micromonosporaceae bacterium]|nr:FAD-binding oxidoreductase [Micromonosporaceae bacterium]
MTEWKILTGWGRTAPTGATVLRDDETTDDRLMAAVAGNPPRGIIARGLARSYGDAAQNGGGLVADLTGRTQVVALDEAAGTLTAEAGLSLDAIMRIILRKGWFVPVTPGTRYVTIGGAIAADIHGKNHHVDGSFSQHVLSFDLLTADGAIRTVRRESDPALFWATAGGMGLTGIILRATIQLRAVETSRVLVDTERAADFDDMLARLEATDHQYTYSVSWIDLLARGGKMGRGVLTRGRHATRDELPVRSRSAPLAFNPRGWLTAPPFLPSGMLNQMTVAAFNEVWFRKAPKVRRGEVQSIPAFFHPLDGVAEWNRIYGPKGFIQYQFVLPFGEEDALRRIVEQVVRSGYASFLAVFKRFGEGNEGLLSFPAPGWTLALDLPASDDLAVVADRLDEAVLAAGGRLYLAKDSRMRAAAMTAMYPRLPAFRELRSTLDPTGMFVSDLARRLSL